MKRRVFLCILLCALMVLPVQGTEINWVDFDVPYESLLYAMGEDVASFEEEKHISWIDILALSACRSGGRCGIESVKTAAKDFHSDRSRDEILGDLAGHFEYYHERYSAVLGGLLGCFEIEKEGKRIPFYGLKAYSPIAEGFGYHHCDDFGAGRTFGFRRRHLGHDMMGTAGTPIVAVEGGVVEALGWNRYGGWRVGIRSFDGRRYYYYAHLQEDCPYAPGLQEGDQVQAGDLLGFMGRTGYSDTENESNIETVHLHFGLQLIFDESQKECDSEIWVDPFALTRLLEKHRCTLVRTEKGWERAYPFRDLDTEEHQIKGRIS